MTLGILSDGFFLKKNGGNDPDIIVAADFCKDLHALIDSSLDADRMDYIMRDAVSSGRDSRIDYKRIFSNMRICDRPDHPGRYVFCFSVKVIVLSTPT